MSEQSEKAFTATASMRSHKVLADQPRENGPMAADAGPSPNELLLSALGACTTQTLRMYATRKGLSLGPVSVELEAQRDDNGIFQVKRALKLTGQLTNEQRIRLKEIANACPVHKTLEGGKCKVETTLIS